MLLFLVVILISGTVCTTGANGKSELILWPENAKLTGRGIVRTNGPFIGWISPRLQLFWDIQFNNVGPLDVALSIANMDIQAPTVFEIQLKNEKDNLTIFATSSPSEIYASPILVPMGRINVPKPGKFSLLLRATAFPGSVAGDLHWVSLSGPATVDAHVMDIYPFHPDSTHLTYSNGDNAIMYYNEVIVSSSVLSTYIAACAFKDGYLGIQERSKPNGKTEKIAIFSLWDLVDADHKIPKPEERAAIVKRGFNVTFGNFGGEGTGIKTTWQFQWQKRSKVEFLLTVNSGQKGFVHYSAFVFFPQLNKWKLIAILKRKAKNKFLNRYYSFLEDWEGGWGHVARQASFNPWIRARNGYWFQPRKATFSSSNPSTINHSNLNGWSKNGRFYMRTGGNTTNTIRFRNYRIERIPDRVFPNALRNIDYIIKHQAYIN